MKYNPEEHPIIIQCKSHKTLPIDRLLEFQGNLKRLTQKNREKLIGSICERGFIAPIFVWDDSGDYRLLDGHQRLKTLLWMREHGWDIPMLPVDIIEADDEQDAKKKLLAISSQYGEFTTDGYAEFTSDIEIEDCVRLVDGEWEAPYKETEDNGDIDAGDTVREPFNDDRDNKSVKELLGGYDNIIASFSGGKDSISMAIELKRLGFAEKTTLVMCAVPVFTFPDEVEYAKYCAGALGLKLEIVKTKETEEQVIEKLKKRGWPGRMLNWCNSDYKVRPLNDYYKTVIGSYIMVMGTRAEESQRRAEMRSRGVWSGRDFLYPIFDETTEDVIKKINDEGIAVHHVYEVFSRYSCSICYQQTKGKWQRLRQKYPEEWMRAITLFGDAIKSDSFRQTDYCADLYRNMTQDPRDEEQDYSLPFSFFWHGNNDIRPRIH